MDSLEAETWMGGGGMGRDGEGWDGRMRIMAARNPMSHPSTNSRAGDTSTKPDGSVMITYKPIKLPAAITD